MELIPGLPNEIAIQCLIRIPFDQLSKAATVCRDWKIQIQLQEFWQRRKAAGCTRTIIAMAQARVNPVHNCHNFAGLPNVPLYRLSLCEPEGQFWYDLPPIPGFMEGIPVFSRLVGVGMNLLVMGGCDPVTLKVLNSVFIYDFFTARWRRGADMPGRQRMFFGCVSDSDRTVLVAGGHDHNKVALRSSMMYDVAKDQWLSMPDMARERDECRCVFHRGKFHVIGGYCTERQGTFETNAEVFDFQTWQWDQIENFLEVAMCPTTSCVSDGDERFYVCQLGNVVEIEHATWIGLPADVCNVACLTAWHNKLFVIGSDGYGGPMRAYVINMNDETLTKIKVPHDNSKHVQSAACLEI